MDNLKIPVIYGLSFGLSFTLGLGLGAILHVNSPRRIPNTEKVQQGYLAPSKLEIFCEDLDYNALPETFMKIGEQRYLLREVDGKPVISAYEVKPAEVVPKSE